MVFSGTRPGAGESEFHDAEGAIVWRGGPLHEVVADPRGITRLPALTPTHTVSSSDGSRSASPDSRIQWQRNVASPHVGSGTSASDQGTQRLRADRRAAAQLEEPSDFHSRDVMHQPAVTKSGAAIGTGRG